MKRLLIMLLALAVLIPVFGISEASCLFLWMEPSCINLAIGGAAVGSVNIWHKNALTTYSNPTAGAFREGISWGFSEKDWLEDTDFGLKANASLVNIGYKGMSITLPSYRLSDMTGVYNDMGMQPFHDDHWHIVGQFHSYETAGVYGFAFNAIELADKYVSSALVKEHLDLAAGIKYKDVKSIYAPPDSIWGIGEGSCWDVGTSARLSWEDKSGVGFEVVASYTHNNLFNDEITWGDGKKDLIWGNENLGYAVAVNLSGEKIIGDRVDPKLLFFDNLISFRYLHNTANEFGDKSKGYGRELGLMDTFFIRKGRYEDYVGDVVGDTFGYGIDLHYKDLISLSWNYAEYPGGGLMDGPQKAEDVNVNMDFLELGKLLKTHFSSK